MSKTIVFIDGNGPAIFTTGNDLAKIGICNGNSRCKFRKMCERGDAVMALVDIRILYEITALERNGFT